MLTAGGGVVVAEMVDKILNLLFAILFATAILGALNALLLENGY